jgi:glucose-6-phosphate isomerase
LLDDHDRCESLIKEAEGMHIDFCRQQATPETLKVCSAECRCLARVADLDSAGLQLLMSLAEAANLKGKIEAMYNGEHINATEDRAVLHVATRARREQVRIRVLHKYCPSVLIYLEMYWP